MRLGAREIIRFLAGGMIGKKKGKQPGTNLSVTMKRLSARRSILKKR